MMKVFRLNEELTNIPNINEGISLCLGNFDGLHLGHQKILFEAFKSDYKVAVITFENLNKRNEALTTLEDRLILFNKHNVDYVFVITFNEFIKNLTHEEFKTKFIDIIKPKLIIGGDDFRFGYSNNGDMKYLSSYYDCKIIPLYKINNLKVSTSLIIELLKKGDIINANKMLGRSYQISGRVVEGFKLGRTLNYPTANVVNSLNYVVPRFGVYKSIIYVRGIPHLSITNVGIHPTVNELNVPLFEAHILNFNEDIYGEKVYLELLEFIRGELKFSSKEELKSQIVKDLKSIKD